MTTLEHVSRHFNTTVRYQRGLPDRDAVRGTRLTAAASIMLARLTAPDPAVLRFDCDCNGMNMHAVCPQVRGRICQGGVSRLEERREASAYGGVSFNAMPHFALVVL